jgi:glucosylceramidase
MDFYLTRGDQTSLLKKQNLKLVFGTATNFYPDINVDSAQTYQAVDGFGFCLTDASAGLISDLPSSMQNDLLKNCLVQIVIHSVLVICV